MSVSNFEFKAEVKELLNLVINSLYSHKEIFLRELLSNASDAINKARYLSLTENDFKIDNSGWKIKIIIDKENKTLTISDNGIGMDRDDVITNLGTIAKSGTKEFAERIKKIKETGDMSLIGQFGVGFYSAFMVAEKIEVISKKLGNSTAVKWSSSAEGSYTVEDIEKEGNGTDVKLFIKDEDKEFLDSWRIREIVKKYSDYIEYPIVMDMEKENKVEEETINSMQAIWLKNKSDVKQEEYNEFYKHIAHDFMDPLETIHYKAEGTLEFTALLFLPSKKPFDIYYKSGKFGPALYVKKVQIMEACEDLVPQYLRFVKGVVDSSDLPLNVSREMLQNNRQITQINKNITKKILETIKSMKKNDFSKYEKFYDEFGNVLKEGIHTDFEKKEEIASLLIFNTIKNIDKKIDFDRYLENMAENQEEIYYITGDTIEEIQKSPQLEYFKDKGIDVILLTGEIDEIIMGSLNEYKGKKVKSIVKGEIKIDENVKNEIEKKGEEFKNFIEKLKEYLKDNVKDVKPGTRLKDSLCCLVGDEHDIDDNIRRLFESMGQKVPESKKILELNLYHPLSTKMKALFDIDPKSPKIKEYAELIFDLALISNGDKPRNTIDFTKKISDLMAGSI